MLKKLVAIVLMGVLMMMLGGCGEKSATKADKLQEITIGTMPDVDSIPFIIAREKGYFAGSEVCPKTHETALFYWGLLRNAQRGGHRRFWGKTGA